MKKKTKKASKFFHPDDATHLFMKNIDKERTFSARLRAYLFGGVLVTAPVGLTLYLSWVFIKYIDAKVTAVLPLSLRPDQLLPYYIPGLGLLVAAVFFILVGWMTASLMGRLIVRLTQIIVAKVPVARSIYSVSKQVLETIVSQKSTSFNEVVLVEYPRRGVWGLGFVTGKTQGEVQEITTDEVINIFVPTTPNPTSGFLLFVPNKDVTRLSMSVEEGIKMVISGGIVTPPDRRPLSKRKSNTIPAVRKRH